MVSRRRFLPMCSPNGSSGRGKDVRNVRKSVSRLLRMLQKICSVISLPDSRYLIFPSDGEGCQQIPPPFSQQQSNTSNNTSHHAGNSLHSVRSRSGSSPSADPDPADTVSNHPMLDVISNDFFFNNTLRSPFLNDVVD